MSRFSIDWSELSLQVMITFGHFLWQACVIGVVLLVVQHVAELLRDSRYLLRLRRGNVSLGETDLRGANIRYTIACVAFFSLPIFVIATFAWVHQSRGPIMLVASDPVHSPPSPMASANEATPTMANTDIPVLPPAAPMNAEVPVTEPIEPPTLVVEPQTSPVQRIQAFAPYLLLAYIVGVSFMLARFSLSIIGSSRLRQTIQPITDASLLKTIAEQCARVGLKRVPVVAICQRVSVPVVVGIVKPMILLPSALLCGLDPTQIAAILSHEIAHIRRYDLIFNLLQRVVEALLFFHPVTWWISRRVSIERENCCDDVAAACMGRLPYAGALLQMAELCIGNDHRRKAALATLSASGSNSTDLCYRIRRLIGAEETTRVGFNRRSFSIGLALVSLLTVSLVAWGQSQKSEKKDAEVDIQWSTSGDKDGLLSGLRLILPESELTPGQPLVVEYRLTNVSKETKTLKCYLNKGMQFTSLSHGNRISGFAERQREPVTITIEPGDVFIDQEHLVSIDTTGLEPGKYHAALGSGFHYSDSVDPNIIHEIPHRGSIPFTIVGESTLKISELPKSDIHWGAPIAGLQVGARFVGDPNAIAIGESVEADLFVANVTSQPIECSVALPHISHGWLFSVMDSNGSAIKLDGPFPLIHSPFPERRVIPLTLAPGEVSPITVDELPLRSRPSFATSRTTQRYLTWPSGADLAGSTTWPKYRIYSLMTQGGAYSATFHVTLIRPELPNLRLELDSGNVPFSVGLQENMPIDIFGTADLKDEDVAAFVDKTLTKPYRPSLGGGSWQLGAHEYSIILTLESIPQQQMVADALMKKIEFSFGSFDMHARKLAMDYCAQHFPDRLLPYLVRRLSATDFPEPDLSTSGQAFPSYYELTVLGDLGEQGKAAIPALMKHLSAGDPIAREATIRSLVRVGPSDPEVMQSLSKCFNDSNVRVQGTAVYQAGRYGELAKPLGPKFVELLEAKSKEVQFWAAAALITSKFNPDLGFERLLAGAKSGERKDRRQALTTLAMLGSRSLAITPELRSMLNDTDPEVVGEVRETIRRIETNDRIVTHAEEAVQKAAARELVSVVAENPANRQTAGALKGRVTVDGVVPLLPKLRVPSPKSPRLRKRATDEELKKYEASLVEIDDESIQVDADKGLANAFVYLAKAPSNWQPTQEDLKPFTLTIQDDRFEPRVAIVRTGQDVRLNNTSVGDDNFAFEPMKNSGQNRAVEAGSEITLEHPFTIPERTPVQAKSHIHPWKTTFLLPLDHPFAAITDKQGRFSIEGLPPGEHSFAIWHEGVGWLEKLFVVRIEAGQTTSTDRAFSVDRFQSAQQALLQKGRELSGKREDLVQRIDRAANQRDKAKRYSSDFYRLDHTLKNQELLLAKFDLENATANIDVPNAPQATPERIAELRELLRIRWGLAVDGIQLGLGMIGDRSEFEPSERISLQVYIRNATEERIAQKLRWFDAANSTSLLRCLAGSPNNIFLSIRSGSSPSQETELHLEPGEIRELPRGRFEMDTAGLHPGVYSVDTNFPVVFPNQAGESATRIARPIDSDATPFELLFHFELIGDQSPLDVIPPDTASEIIGTSEATWGTAVFGLQAGARFRNDETISGEIGTAGAALPRSSIKHHTHIGDTVKTELLVRNISNQPIEVRFQPAMGKEIQSLSAMESALTEQNSRAIMRRSPVEALEKSTQTIERTLQPGEQFVMAHQDFEIQQLFDGRERQLSRPETNRHWVPGQGDYVYRAYLKLGITDSLSVSLHSGGIKIRIDADEKPQGANQAVTAETMASPPGEPNMNDDLKEISELIATGKTIPQELNDKYQAVHLKLTAAERLKSVKLLAVPDFVLQDVLSESSYSLEEKVALLSELKDRNFGKLEFGMQECMANLATEYAQSDPAATREWLAQFQGAEYGVGMGLTAVLKATKQKDPAKSLEILRSLSDAEGECLVTCGDIPKYELPASDWLKEVQRFKSNALRSCFLGGPMVFHFGEESPEAALDYILTIPKETRTPQLGYQLVGCVLRSKRFTWTEILDWMETKLPIETRSPEHYGLLADTWSQQDNASFQQWFQGLKDPVIRDEAIRGIQAVGQPQDWAAMFALAQQITDQTKRQSKVAWVLNAWKLTDPSAALAQLDNADVSKERRIQLHRDITARLKQVGNVAANDSSRSLHWIPTRPLKVTASKEVSAKILDDHSVRLEGEVQWQEASLQFAFEKSTNVEEIRLEILPVDSPTGPQFGRGGKELMLFDVKPSIEEQTGKFTSLDFASCTYLQNPSDDTAANCIDYLSDTGWKVPLLPADATAHELVLRFEKPVTLRADQRLSFTVDSGSAKELAVLNRIRVAFRQRTDE